MQNAPNDRHLSGAWFRFGLEFQRDPYGFRWTVEPAMSSPRGTLVCKAERWVKGHPHRPIHVADVCAAFNIPLRTFQRIFHETVGVGPAHFFAAVRLNQARAALLAGSPFTTSVTQIALDHGFRELGRFAGAYRRTFGETPSETLHGGHNKLAAATRHEQFRHSSTKPKTRMKETHEHRLKEQPWSRSVSHTDHTRNRN